MHCSIAQCAGGCAERRSERPNPGKTYTGRAGFTRKFHWWTIGLVWASVGLSPICRVEGQSYIGEWSFQKKQRGTQPALSNEGLKSVKFYKPDGAQLPPQLSDGSPDPSQNHPVKLTDEEASAAGWVPPPDPPNPQSAQPAPFRVPDHTRTLVPADPTERSFTDLNSLMETDQRPTVSNAAKSNSVLAFDSSRQKTTASRFEVQSTSFEEADDQPATRNSASPATPTDPAVARVCQLVARYQPHSTNSGTQKEFNSLRLIDMVKQPVSVSLRSSMVSQYWDTWRNWAEMSSRGQYVQWIGSISGSPNSSDGQLLLAARSLAENQVLEAKSDLIHSQTKLQSFIPVQVHEAGALPLPPLPVDQPLIHRYVTNYQLYRSYRSLPARFQNIDAELSNTLELIVQHGNTVELARASAESQQSAFRNGAGNLSALLEAGRIWRVAEHDLIMAVARYNQMIADYSLSVTDGSQTPETVVAMLIGHAASRRAPGDIKSDVQMADSESSSTDRYRDSAMPETGEVDRTLGNGFSPASSGSRNPERSDFSPEVSSSVQSNSAAARSAPLSPPAFSPQGPTPSNPVATGQASAAPSGSTQPAESKPTEPWNDNKPKSDLRTTDFPGNATANSFGDSAKLHGAGESLNSDNRFAQDPTRDPTTEPKVNQNEDSFGKPQGESGATQFRGTVPDQSSSFQQPQGLPAGSGGGDFRPGNNPTGFSNQRVTDPADFAAGKPANSGLPVPLRDSNRSAESGGPGNALRPFQGDTVPPPTGNPPSPFLENAQKLNSAQDRPAVVGEAPAEAESEKGPSSSDSNSQPILPPSNSSEFVPFKGE